MRIIFKSFTWKDTNAATVAITGDSRMAIQRKSMIEYSFAAESSEGAIERFELYVSDDEPCVTIPGSLSKYSRHVYDGARTYQRIIAYDTAGNSVEAGGWLDILPYSPPAVDGTAKRINNFESETEITASATVADLGGNNSKVLTYQYRKVGAATYSDPVTLEEGETAVTALDRNFPWEVKFTAADAFEEATEVVTVAKGQPIVFVDRVKRSASVDGFPVHESALEAPAIYAAGALLHPKLPMYATRTVTAAASGASGTVVSLSLPAGKFLALGSIQSSIGPEEVQLALLAAGATGKLLCGQAGRGSMSRGGGTNAWGLFEFTEAGTLSLNSYNYYSSNSYQWYGHLFVLQLD